ncbi:hypothetical protein [Mycolicibacterium thermoresistibile]|uniref:Uncharacterized protein n=1 Tax=Mycolicibacterium thermoresistibile TaxID=1797 RepID=A0A124E7N9_MYCTH|nr:hypothetical protein [Mycolicibacterium thermoresistibile]MCV7187000.1 hypothetical protein [Mycolicibacterium thermoresistibile]GAT13176.1 uncharacterized protein RMCT_0148 [Mycolicibacterium thermoresistibile]
MNRLHFCPACGLFGRKKRRRDEQALIAFHSLLAAQARRERAVKLTPIWSPADTAELLAAAAAHEAVPAAAAAGWVDHGTHREWCGGPCPTSSELWGGAR